MRKNKKTEIKTELVYKPGSPSWTYLSRALSMLIDKKDLARHLERKVEKNRKTKKHNSDGKSKKQ